MTEHRQYHWIEGATLKSIEREVIEDALHQHNGNRTHTARALGISVRTVRNLLQRYAAFDAAKKEGGGGGGEG